MAVVEICQVISMRRRRAIYSISSVCCALKNPSAPTVPFAASSSESSFADASAASAGAMFVAVAVVAASKDEEKKNMTPPSPPHPCLSAGQNLSLALGRSVGDNQRPRRWAAT